MKNIPADLAAHLAGGITTTCHCWKVTLRDGRIVGFTEHDQPLSFGGVNYMAASGFQAAETESETGLAANSGEVAGGFSNEAITEADLVAGHYDGAKVELYLVNWQQPQQNLLLNVREVGEVTRAGAFFQAELRSVAHRLGQPQGRVYGRRCDAALGDARCGKSLAGLQGQGTVISADENGRLTVSGLGGFANGFFSLGSLTFTSGKYARKVIDLDRHMLEDGLCILQLWLPLSPSPDEGDTFRVTAGCDKSFVSCKAKFANHLNFRGFPHMPGADFAYSYVSGSSAHDGGAIFK